MGAPKQTGKIKVKCNVCKTESEIPTIDYYKPGGFKGGCCKEEKIINFTNPDGSKTKREITVGNTWSTVPAGKMKTQKPSRDRKGRGSMKG